VKRLNLLFFSEYLVRYTASKVEAKRLREHSKFQGAVAKFWQLLRREPDCDLSKMTVSKD
jgi:hypothetical protein